MTYEPDPDPRYVRADDPPVEQVVQPVGAQYGATGTPASATAVPVEQVVVAQPAAVHQRVATTYGQRFAFDSLIVGLVGLAMTIVGLIALTRAGFDGPMDQPVVKVLGSTHTATLGAIETGFGICLLICAAATARAVAVFFGLVLGVAGIVGAVQTSSFRRSLALQSGLAWWAVIAAAVVVLVSLLVPRVARSTTRVAAY